MNALLTMTLALLAPLSHAAPNPAQDLADHQQADAYRAAQEARESVVSQIAGDRDLAAALAGELLVPRADDGEFRTEDSEYIYDLDIVWEPEGDLNPIVRRLGSALGSAKNGDVFCIGGDEEVASKLTVAPNMTAPLLEQLGVSSLAIRPRDRILGTIGGDAVSLNTHTLGPLLFAAVLTSVERASSPVDARLLLYTPKPLVIPDSEDIIRVKTSKNRTIDIPVDIVGDTAKLDQDAIDEARWRIAGTTREAPLDLSHPAQRALLQIALKSGMAELSGLRKETMYPVAKQRVELPPHEVHLLGDRNAWFDVHDVGGTAIVATRRTADECDVAVEIIGRTTKVGIGPLPGTVWPMVKLFQIINTEKQQARLAFLDAPAQGRDAGGISNEDFDERLTRADRCERACTAVPRAYQARMVAARQAWIAEQKEQSKNGEVDESEYRAPQYKFAEMFAVDRCQQTCNVSRGYAQCISDLDGGSSRFLRELDICEAKSPNR